MAARTGLLQQSRAMRMMRGRNPPREQSIGHRIQPAKVDGFLALSPKPREKTSKPALLAAEPWNVLDRASGAVESGCRVARSSASKSSDTRRVRGYVLERSQSRDLMPEGFARSAASKPTSPTGCHRRDNAEVARLIHCIQRS